MSSPLPGESSDSRPDVAGPDEAAASEAWFWLAWLHWLLDFFWPSLDAWTPEEEDREREKLRSQLLADLALVGQVPDGQVLEALEGVKTLTDNEEERRKSVESRLTTVLGLASVAAAVTLASAAQILRAVESIAGGVPAEVKLFGAFSAYASLQLLAAVLAAVRGLGRRGYQLVQAKDLLPSGDETDVEFSKRKMTVLLESLACNSQLNSAKVEQMALAHRAIQNFIGGMLFLTLLLALLICGVL